MPSPDSRSSRLATFVADLALDRDKLRRFLADLEDGTEDEMDAAELSPKERGYLTARSFRDLCGYLWRAGEQHGPEPSPDEDPGG